MPKKLRQLLAELEANKATKKVYVLFHFHVDDAIAAAHVRQYLAEGGKTVSLGKGRAASALTQSADSQSCAAVRIWPHGPDDMHHPWRTGAQAADGDRL